MRGRLWLPFRGRRDDALQGFEGVRRRRYTARREGDMPRMHEWGYNTIGVYRAGPSGTCRECRAYLLGMPLKALLKPNKSRY
jgi:hypothetical protein